MSKLPIPNLFRIDLATYNALARASGLGSVCATSYQFDTTYAFIQSLMFVVWIGWALLKLFVDFGLFHIAFTPHPSRQIFVCDLAATTPIATNMIFNGR